MASYQGLDSKGARKPTPAIKVPDELVDDANTPRVSVKASFWTVHTFTTLTPISATISPNLCRPTHWVIFNLLEVLARQVNLTCVSSRIWLTNFDRIVLRKETSKTCLISFD